MVDDSDLGLPTYSDIAYSDILDTVTLLWCNNMIFLY